MSVQAGLSGNCRIRRTQNTDLNILSICFSVSYISYLCILVLTVVLKHPLTAQMNYQNMFSKKRGLRAGFANMSPQAEEVAHQGRTCLLSHGPRGAIAPAPAWNSTHHTFETRTRPPLKTAIFSFDSHADTSSLFVLTRIISHFSGPAFFTANFHISR